MKQNRSAAALGLGGMVGVNLAIQLLVVYFQCRKGPLRSWIKEVFVVLAGMKPGFDAMKVASGNEKASYSMLHPETVRSAPNPLII
jgi:hypothetical protein